MFPEKLRKIFYIFKNQIISLVKDTINGLSIITRTINMVKLNQMINYGLPARKTTPSQGCIVRRSWWNGAARSCFPSTAKPHFEL